MWRKCLRDEQRAGRNDVEKSKQSNKIVAGVARRCRQPAV